MPRTRRSVNFSGSMSMPVDRRKNGMSSTPPTNSTCSMSRLRAGTSRFTASPAKNAPTIPSIPPRSATSAAPVSPTSTQRNRAPRCCPTPAKTQRVTRGSTNAHTQREDDEPDGHLEQENAPGAESLATDPATTARTDSASVSVMTVPPPAMPTARSRRSPCSWTIGYATSVCDAQSDPKSSAVAVPVAVTGGDARCRARTAA